MNICASGYVQPALTSFCHLAKSHPKSENGLGQGPAKVKPPAALETPLRRGFPGAAAGVWAEGFGYMLHPPSQFL